MDCSNLIIESLGLQGLIVESYKSDRGLLRIDIFTRQPIETAICLYCHGPIAQIHDWRDRTLRGPPLGAFKEVVVHVKIPRGTCLACDARRQACIVGVHPQFQNLTCAMAEMAGRLMEEITCEATARLLRLNPKTMWDLDQWRMRRMLKEHKVPADIDTRLMSADEVHFRTHWKKGRRRWGEQPWEAKFITNLVCYTSGKVVWNSPDRSEESLEACLLKLSEPQRLMIEFFAVDLHDPYIKVVRKYCPQASICADRFHLVQLANKAFDEVRRDEFKKARDNNDKLAKDMLAPHRRFILVEKEKTLSKFDLSLLEKLREANKNIQNAMLLLEYFHAVLDTKEVIEFRKRLALWYRVSRQARLTPFLKFAKTVRKYRIGIENFIRSRLTTAVSEGLNNKIKVLKRMGYGYTNEKSFRLKILQRCGYLNSYHLDTTDWHWHVPHPQ